MTAGNYDINCVAGQDLSVIISIANPDLTKSQIVYWGARMQVRDRISSENVIVELTTDNGRITKDISNGRILLNLTAEETSALSDDGVYDLELYSTMGKPAVIRLLQGYFNLV